MDQSSDLLSQTSANSASASPLTINLLLALLLLVLIMLLAGIVIFLIRRHRRRMRMTTLLPLGMDKKKQSRHRRHDAASSLPFMSRSWLRREKQDFINTTSGPPASAQLPEIRITFPEEVDEGGKRSSGRVVVVHMGEQGVGLAPLPDHLPSYQLHSAETFHDLDMNTLGGLRDASWMNRA